MIRPTKALASATVVLGLFAGACAGSSTTDVASSTTGEAATLTGESDLPDVEMINLNTGETVQLASYAPAGKPIVLWFWAPY
jgi:hypothetical protein